MRRSFGQRSKQAEGDLGGWHELLQRRQHGGGPAEGGAAEGAPAEAGGGGRLEASRVGEGAGEEELLWARPGVQRGGGEQASGGRRLAWGPGDSGPPASERPARPASPSLADSAAAGVSSSEESGGEEHGGPAERPAQMGRGPAAQRGPAPAATAAPGPAAARTAPPQQHAGAQATPPAINGSIQSVLQAVSRAISLRAPADPAASQPAPSQPALAVQRRQGSAWGSTAAGGSGGGGGSWGGRALRVAQDAEGAGGQEAADEAWEVPLESAAVPYL